MSFGPLISAEALKSTAAAVRLLDARPGAEAYAAGHLPGALHADLDRELSAASEPGFDPARGGRHPLPALATWTAQLGAWGIGPETMVVAYDDASGGVAACRLWWMLRAVGHERVAVLDGGLQAAQAAGLELTRAEPPAPGGRRLRTRATAGAAPPSTSSAVDRLLEDPAWKVLDVRSRERWRGERRDPESGGGPASRAPSTCRTPRTWTPTGRFKPPAALRQQYLELLGGTPRSGSPCTAGPA